MAKKEISVVVCDRCGKERHPKKNNIVVDDQQIDDIVSRPIVVSINGKSYSFDDLCYRCFQSLEKIVEKIILYRGDEVGKVKGKLYTYEEVLDMIKQTQSTVSNEEDSTEQDSDFNNESSVESIDEIPVDSSGLPDDLLQEIESLVGRR